MSIAGADDNPGTEIAQLTQLGPKAGYWYRALRFGDEDPEKTDPDRFAFAAYPDAYGTSGNWIIIISNDNEIYKKSPGEPLIPEIYPVDPESEGWERVH